MAGAGAVSTVRQGKSTAAAAPGRRRDIIPSPPLPPLDGPHANIALAIKPLLSEAMLAEAFPDRSRLAAYLMALSDSGNYDVVPSYLTMSASHPARRILLRSLLSEPFSDRAVRALAGIADSLEDDNLNEVLTELTNIVDPRLRKKVLQRTVDRVSQWDRRASQEWEDYLSQLPD